MRLENHLMFSVFNVAVSTSRFYFCACQSEKQKHLPSAPWWPGLFDPLCSSSGAVLGPGVRPGRELLVASNLAGS